MILHIVDILQIKIVHAHRYGNMQYKQEYFKLVHVMEVRLYYVI